MATVKCPSCVKPLEVEDTYRDWTVRCPQCGHEFVPSDAGAGPPRPPEDDRPRRRPRDEDDRDDRDDRDARRYRDRDRDYEDDEPDERDEVPDRVREEALVLVAAPATWLEICGWLTVLGTFGLMLLFVALVGAANNANGNGNQNQNDDMAVLVFMGCCMAVLGIPYGVAMAIGARKMRNLSNRGWAMTSAILGIAAFSVFGVLGLIQAGIGTWALVTLDKPVVRRAFGLAPRNGSRRRRRRDWDD